MSDNGRPASIAEKMYPDHPSSRTGGTAPAAAPQPAPARQESLADRMYSERPSPGLGNARAMAAAARQPAAAPQQQQTAERSPAAERQPETLQSLAQRFFSTPSEQPSDSDNPPNDNTNQPADETAQVEQHQSAAEHEALMSEFTSEADAMGLGREERQALLEMHDRAVGEMYKSHERQVGEWRKQSEAAFNSYQLTDIRNRFTRLAGNDEAAREARRLLAWSGLGNNRHFLTVMSRLMQR
jgi:hypothetical protein